LVDPEPPEPVIACDARYIVGPDIGTVDALARLVLAARRLGYQVRLERAAPDLVELVELAGLCDVVGGSNSVVEAGGQAEQREVARGVEEEDDPADSPA
jgi:hypothetical protein